MNTYCDVLLIIISIMIIAWYKRADKDLLTNAEVTHRTSNYRGEVYYSENDMCRRKKNGRLIRKDKRPLDKK